MPGLLKYGAGGMQALQQADMNDQIMQMRALAIQGSENKLADAQRQEEARAKAAHIMQQIQSGGVPAPGDTNTKKVPTYADGMQITGSRLMSMGLPVMGQKYLTGAKSMQAYQSKLVNDRLDQQKKVADLRMQQAETIASVAKTAKTGAEFDQAIQQMIDSGGIAANEGQHLQNIPWTPQTKSFLINRARKVKDIFAHQLQEQQETRIAAHQHVTEQQTKRRNDIAQANLQERKWANRHKDKQGKPATAPNSNTIAATEAIVRSEIFPEGMPSSIQDSFNKDNPISSSYQAYKAGIQSIASAAMRRVRENQGITMSQAIHKEVALSRARGEWDIEGEDDTFGEPDQTVGFTTQGKTPGAAMPMPTLPNGKPDRSVMKKSGDWFIGPAGNPIRFKGGKVEVWE